MVTGFCLELRETKGSWADIEYNPHNNGVRGLKMDGRVLFSRVRDAISAGFFWLMPLLFINISALRRAMRFLRRNNGVDGAKENKNV